MIPPPRVRFMCQRADSGRYDRKRRLSFNWQQQRCLSVKRSVGVWPLGKKEKKREREIFVERLVVQIPLIPDFSEQIA